MQRAVVFAGFGGQGLLFAGEALAQAALEGGLETLWMPSYGPEMRGGSAACTVIVADERIGSPMVDRFDAAVILTAPALARFGPRMARDGLLLLDTSLAGQLPEMNGATVLPIDLARLAHEGGSERLAAVVGLGALSVGLRDDRGEPLLDRRLVRESLRRLVAQKHPGMVESDLVALEAGARKAVAASKAGALAAKATAP